jgi:hypothetical protein
MLTAAILVHSDAARLFYLVKALIYKPINIK